MLSIEMLKGCKFWLSDTLQGNIKALSAVYIDTGFSVFFSIEKYWC